MEEKEEYLKWKVEEEKKESSPKKTGSNEAALARTTTTTDDDLQLEKAQEGLPSEIKKKSYFCERELRTDLEKLGADDLQIVLDKQGFAVWREMPGEAHRSAVREIIDLFDEWKDGRMIKGEKEANVFLHDSFSRPKREMRCPDVAIFGPDRLQGRKLRKVGGKCMNPHIIIQFSWTNDIVDEALAIDDMMHHAGVGEYSSLGRPNTAYLIKALRRGKEVDSPVYGFNVFQVDQDQDTPNEPTMKYRCGGQEDTEIKIATAKMGLEGDEGEPFTIAMRDIRKELEDLNIIFVQAEENEM